MKYSIQHIETILHAQSLNTELYPSDIHHVIFDSRKVIFAQSSIFFAFKSTRNDGHDFIPELYKKGIRNFVISKELNIDAFSNANFLLVEDPVYALQQLAIHHRKNYNIPVIGITGSNGKTIIKEWLFQLLEDDYNIIRSPRSFNSQIGVPISVLQMDPVHNLAIFEAGVSKTGEMHNLQSIIDCSIGIFTNIGEAHNEGFKNLDEKILEKLKLFEDTSILFYCKDHSLVDYYIQQKNNTQTKSWSRTQTADLQIIKEEKKANNTYLVKGKYAETIFDIEIPFSDPALIENAIHCWLLMLHFNIPQFVIKQRMATLSSIAMRLELKAGINGSTLINDSYSSDLTSLSSALNFMDQHSGELSKTIVLSDIFQSGKSNQILYSEVAQLLNEKQVSKIIGIGNEIPLIGSLSTALKKEFYQTTTAFLSQLKPETYQNEIILIKGARDFEFEKIVSRLARKNHNTILEINLNALVHNLNIYKQHLKKTTKIMAMVKAAAYGSGGDEVARLLQSQHVDYLAVAYADEGVELRKAGIKLPIMVLNPEKATFEILIRYQLEPEVYSLNLLKQLIDFIPSGQATTIHLKLDTGMHRLGFELQDLEELIQILNEHPHLNVGSIFSHLAASDESEHDIFTQQQVSLFKTLYTKISEKTGRRAPRHILNSSGIVRFSQYQLEMVRLGIGLYGIDISASLKQKLETVLTLKASISQIKQIKKGESIGYGRKGKADQDMLIATISIGYADGFLRKAGNGRYQVLIRNQKVPTIGNICMDMAMVDITAIPEASEGDEVIIFGPNHPVEDLAICYESLVYEVFTGISERVKRVYFQD